MCKVEFWWIFSKTQGQLITVVMVFEGAPQDFFKFETGKVMSDGWAIAFLVLAGIAYVGLFVYLLKRKGRYTVGERLLYAPVYVLSRVLWRVEINWDPSWGDRSSHEMLRDRIIGGAVLIANHRSSVDPFFVQLAAGGRVHWMVAGEYFKHFLFGPLLRSYQAIPTNRGGFDNASTKRAIRLASEGGLVGMFPEGRINRTVAPMLSIRPGAAMVAARAGVPLVPIWIIGAPSGNQVYSALFRAAHVRVIVGSPCRAPSALVQDPSLLEDMKSNKLSRTETCDWITTSIKQAMSLAQIEGQAVQVAGKDWVAS
jgi:1-acyl-sn-glycerol-3-phosphate acyltransferase